MDRLQSNNTWSAPLSPRIRNIHAMFGSLPFSGSLEEVQNDFRLSFFITINPKTSRWNGAAATIAPAKGSSVWGTVWELGVEDIPSLDRQEGIYKALNVDVISEDRSLTCRTYLLEPTTVPSDWDMRPSPQYMDIIIKGAIQSKLPDEYIDQLKNVEHNNYSGPMKKVVMNTHEIFATE
ncbi:hypothetical protein AM593_09959, partial [Mytilus galloprovincialis]